MDIIKLTAQDSNLAGREREIEISLDQAGIKPTEVEVIWSRRDIFGVVVGFNCKTNEGIKCLFI